MEVFPLYVSCLCLKGQSSLVQMELLLFVVSILSVVHGFFQPLPEGMKTELPYVNNGIDPGPPLYLTPLIEQGKYDEGNLI